MINILICNTILFSIFLSLSAFAGNGDASSSQSSAKRVKQMALWLEQDDKEIRHIIETAKEGFREIEWDLSVTVVMSRRHTEEECKERYVELVFIEKILPEPSELAQTIWRIRAKKVVGEEVFARVAPRYEITWTRQKDAQLYQCIEIQEHLRSKSENVDITTLTEDESVDAFWALVALRLFGRADWALACQARYKKLQQVHSKQAVAAVLQTP